MFFEQIGDYTRSHLRSHIRAYLLEQQTLHDDKIPLVMPKSIDLSSMVGGTIQVARDTLPQYAINVLSKSPSQIPEDYFAYNYPGQIMVLVGGRSAKDVDLLAMRHAAAIEKFAKEHPHLHQYSDADGFTLLHWIWNRTTFSGAMNLEGETDSDGEFWVNGAQIDFTWTTSEMGSDDQNG
jgi:hypothetical protein